MVQKKHALLYAATSANLYNFLGHSDFEMHMKVYNTVAEYALKAHRDLMEFEVDNLQIIDPANVLSGLHTNPPIFISFHTGSFNMLAALLLKNGLHFDILSDTQSSAKDDYKQTAELYSRHYNNNCSLEMVNVEKDGAIFRIIQNIRQGTVTLAFLDGNKGIGGQTKTNENMLDVNFLQGKVKVRKGLPFMAYVTKAPIVLALNYHENGVDYLHIHEPLQVEETNREQFCITAMDMIFKRFEDHIRKYYAQWANWPYMHNWSDLAYFQDKIPPLDNSPVIDDASTWIFNISRFCPLKLDDKPFLFDRLQYVLHSVEPSYISLFSYKTPREEKNGIVREMFAKEKASLQQLISRNILIKDSGY